MELVVEDYGVLVTKHSERVQVKKDGKVIQEVPLIHLESIVLASSGLTLSSDMVEVCAERGIPISFVSRQGKLVAQLYGMEAGTSGTVETRHQQLQAEGDERGMKLARAIALGKLHNQAALLRYVVKSRRRELAVHEATHALAAAIDGIIAEVEGLTALDLNSLRPQLLNREGRGAQFYWQGVQLLLPEDLQWPGRRRRGADDPFNMALNYGYAILAGQVDNALRRAGLDPYAGFLHTDRAGKTSLVYDAMEEFRPLVVDRAVMRVFNLRMRLQRDDDGRFDAASRKLIAQQVFARLDHAHEYEGKKQQMKRIILLQAQRIANHVRKIKEYQSYAIEW